MKPNYTVRPATPADIDRLVAMQKKFSDHHRQLDPKWCVPDRGRAAFETFVRGLMKKRRDFLFLVVTKNDRIVGYATADIEKESPIYRAPRLGHIGSIYIEPQERRNGLSKKAVAACMEWFHKNNVRDVYLEVDIKNTNGVAAWRNAGFREWRLAMRRGVSFG